MDVTHIPVGEDGRAHLAAVIDCHGRRGVRVRLAGTRARSRGRPRDRPHGALPDPPAVRRDADGATVRRDNGLVFQSRRFCRACKGYLLRHEFITPYTPEPNGVIERFFRSLKEECAWQHSFAS